MDYRCPEKLRYGGEKKTKYNVNTAVAKAGTGHRATPTARTTSHM